MLLSVDADLNQTIWLWPQLPSHHCLEFWSNTYNYLQDLTKQGMLTFEVMITIITAFNNLFSD